MSDDIWVMGSLEEIKQEVSPETFVFHIAVNTIGNWKCDGWGYIFSECHPLLAYISEALDKLRLSELKNQFDELHLWMNEYFTNEGIPFLDFAQAYNETMHTDVMKFLINPRFHVKNEKLHAVGKEDRKSASLKYQTGMERLDHISQKYWDYGAEEEGWKAVSDYIKKIELLNTEG
ncbi:MAG: hypothetical protein Q4A30_02600 [Candidatus Saccharibacteria bacterium]|nr:hypothetical protein [Candidatus Saccharibacteria bacterium]